MPYIVTTKQPDERTGSSGERSHVEFASRLAVATLEKARRIIIDAVTGTSRSAAVQYDALVNYADTVPESGGTVGPLPDGTVIEVEQADWSLLARSCDPPLPIAGPAGSEWTEAEKQIILDTFNAREPTALGAEALRRGR
jgi:hypothetical protein